MSTVDQSQMRTRGEGVKKSQNFADVIYGWPLLRITLLFVGHSFPRDPRMRVELTAPVIITAEVNTAERDKKWPLPDDELFGLSLKLM